MTTRPSSGQRGPNNHRSVQLPGLPAVKTDNPALNQFLEAVRERLEVRDGARGDPYERAVTLRDLEGAGFPVSTIGRQMISRGGVGGRPDFTTSGLDKLLGGSMLFTNLLKEVQNLRSNNELPSRVAALVSSSILAEAAARRADVRSISEALQTEVESFAYQLNEVTAAIEGASAGMRVLNYASATETRAVAGRVVQIAAALDGVGSASFDESVQVIADRMIGLRSTYMLQVNAGGAVAGISLLASEDPEGNTQSAFVVEADQFVVAAPINFTSSTTPTAATIGQIWFNPTTQAYSRSTATGTAGWVAYTPSAPFGVDTTTGTVYINGQLRVNAGGGALGDLAAEAGRYTELRFQRNTSQPATPTGATPAGWTTAIPTGTDPVYATRATKNADGSLFGVWSTPALAFRDGTAGTNGSPGQPGPQGLRGSIAAYGSRYGYSNSFWDDSVANAVIFNFVVGFQATNGTTDTSHLRIGDTVTLSNGSTFAATRYWGGSQWLTPGVVIDGNLLVSGTVSADRVDTRGITVKDNNGVVIFSVGVGLDTPYIKVGAVTELYAASDPAGVVVHTSNLTPTYYTLAQLTVAHPGLTAATGAASCVVSVQSGGTGGVLLEVVRATDGFLLASATVSFQYAGVVQNFPVSLNLQNAGSQSTAYVFRVRAISDPNQYIQIQNRRMILTLNKR